MDELGSWHAIGPSRAVKKDGRFPQRGARPDVPSADEQSKGIHWRLMCSLLYEACETGDMIIQHDDR